MKRNVFALLAALLLLGGFRSGSSSDWAIGADGWTNFTARTGTGTCNATHSGTYSGTCKIYVSSSTGDNTNCTAIVATATPTSGPGGQTCATLAVATAMLRDHSDDWLLLNKGDTWSENFTSFNGGSNEFCVNGISPYRPMLITSYGAGARPLIKTATTASATTAAVFTLGNCPIGASNTAWVGIEFYSFDRDPANGGFVQPVTNINTYAFFLLAVTQWMLVEDCKMSFYASNFVAQTGASAGYASNLSLRRNVIVDAYGIQPDFEQGAYIQSTNNVELYQNVFDHNGWNATVTGGTASIFSHNVYMAGGEPPGTQTFPTNATFTENIFANDGQGNQNRNGVVGLNNLHLLSGITTALGAPNAGGTTYSQNVVLEGVDEPSGCSGSSCFFGWGINTLASYSGDSYIIGPTLIQNNIMANTKTTSGNGFGIKLLQGSDRTTVSGNIICNWQSAAPISFTGSVTSVNNLVGGSGYTDGSYPVGNIGVASSYVTSGAGTGFAPFIVVSGGQVTQVGVFGNPNNGNNSIMGQGYSVGDQLTVVNSLIGGTGSGFSFKVASLGVNTIGTNTTKSADCSGLGFPAPTPPGGQTLTGNYYGSIGGSPSTTAAFLAAARLRSRDNDNPLLTAGAHNNYVRQTGFGVATYPYNVAPFQ